MSTILVMFGLAAIVVALWGLIRGRVSWAHIGSRKRSAQVAAGGFVAMVVGAAFAPPATVAVHAAAPMPTVTVTVTAAPVTVTATPTPTPTPTPTETVAPAPEPTPTQVANFVGNGGVGAAPKSAATAKAAPKAAATTKAAPKTAPKAAPKSAYYKNCTAARAAGVTPIYRGQPGYASHLDRDNDGIACE